MSAEPVDQEQTAVRRLLTENQKLKQRVFDLEEKLRKISGEGHTSSGSSVLKLIEHKDFQLQQCSARLEEKKEQLAEASAELARWADALRFYQDIFDNDASAMIGVNLDGRIVLFNATAPKILGEKFVSALNQPIETVDFRAFDPDTPKHGREALAGKKPADTSVKLRERTIVTSILSIGTEAKSRGALVRIQVVASK